MITIISGTNRNDSFTRKVALEYQRFLTELNIESQILSLEEHEAHRRNDAFIKMENGLLKTAERFIFILPEYNGSYPGVLKMMIEQYKELFMVNLNIYISNNLIIFIFFRYLKIYIIKYVLH